MRSTTPLTIARSVSRVFSKSLNLRLELPEFSTSTLEVIANLLGSLDTIRRCFSWSETMCNPAELTNVGCPTHRAY